MPVLSSVIITVAFCVLILLTGCYVTTRRFSWLIRNRGLLFGIIALLGIIIYSIGYLASKECGKSVGDCISAGLMAVFSTSRMFVLENDFGEFYQDALTPAYRIAFGIVMTMAMLVIVMAVLSVFGFGFLSALRIRMLRIFGTRRQVYIFSCLNKQALSLVRDIKKTDPRALVLFIVPHQKEDICTDEKQLLKAAAQDNTFIFLSELDERTKKTANMLYDFGLFRSLKKTHVHFLANNDNLAINASVFLKLSKLLKNSDLSEAVTLHVLTDETIYGHIFDNPELTGVNFIPLDMNALASLDLVSRLPIISCAKARFHDGCADGILTVLVIGESPVIPYLLRDIITQGQFFGLKLNLIVAYEKSSDLIAHFFAGNPEAKRYVTLSAKDILPDSAAFFDYFRSSHQDINMVICAGNDDEFNIRLVKTLKSMTKSAPSQTKFCTLIRSADIKKALDGYDILTFGDESIIEQAAVIIDEQLDQMSKAVHEYYRRIYNDERTWQRIAYYERESSRALAMHIQSKLYALGLQTMECKDYCKTSGEYEALLSSNTRVLENLSIGEHRRWCAHLATHGWTLPSKKEEFVKSITLKQHPCLVDWDKLDRVSEAHSGSMVDSDKRVDYKDIDRHLIASLAEIAKDGHMKIVKKETI